jgi:ArsR family transcriptional regulator
MDKNIDITCIHGSCEEHELHVELLNSINEKMPSDEKIFDLAELFKMFGDSTRMKILFVLFESEACTCDLAEVLKMTPSAISHQLKTLQRAKLVKSRRDGRAVYYSLADDHVRTMIEQGMEHIEE